MTIAFPKQSLLAILNRCGAFLACGSRVCRNQLRLQSAAAEYRRLESQKLDKFQQMGRIVYEMYKEDRVRTKRLSGLCQSVAQLDAECSAATNRAEAIRHPERSG